MAAIVEFKRDFEICANYKSPSVSLKFDWTIEDYDVDVLKNYQSPTVELHGATMKFILERSFNSSAGSYNPNRAGTYNPNPSNSSVYYDHLAIWSSSSVVISGSVMVNGMKHAILKKRIGSGDNKNVISNFSQVNLSLVKIVFDLQVYGLKNKEFVFSKKKSEPKVDMNEYRKNFMDSIQALWLNHRFSDIRIRVGRNKKTIKAHKIILSARSPVFSRMFQSPTVEGTGDTVDVTDVPFETLERLIGFLYGRLPEIDAIRDDKLSELYYASDKYQVLYLRNVCGTALINRMTAENACQLIDLFDRHSDFDSIEKVVDFCCMHFTDVAKSDGWKSMNPKYSTMIIEKMTKICK